MKHRITALGVVTERSSHTQQTYVHSAFNHCTSNHGRSRIVCGKNKRYDERAAYSDIIEHTINTQRTFPQCDCITFKVEVLTPEASEQINRINTLFKRSYRCGFAKQINDIVTLVDNASKDLFGKTMAPHHCLHSLLPLPIEKKHDLRTRGHNYLIPQCKYNLHSNSFLVRSLFECV